MIYTTLNKIRSHGPCTDGWTKLLKHLGKTGADDEPLSLLTVLESNGLDDALWCLRAVDGQQQEMRLYAVWCARQVQHLMTDPRALTALDVAERHAYGEASDKELSTAWDAARDAAWYAAGSPAAAAAWAAARAAAWAAAAAEGAEWAAVAVAEAAMWAAKAKAKAAARAAQEAEFRRVFCKEESE